MTEYTDRRVQISAELAKEEERIYAMDYENVDYEIIARRISAKVKTAVVVFPAPTGGGRFKLVAYEVPFTLRVSR